MKPEVLVSALTAKEHEDLVAVMPDQVIAGEALRRGWITVEDDGNVVLGSVPVEQLHDDHSRTALRQAARLVLDHFGVNPPSDEERVVPQPPEGGWDQYPLHLLKVPDYAHAPLFRAGIRTVGDLLSHSEKDLLKISRFGRTRLETVKDTLDHYGLQLPDDLDVIDPPSNR